MAALLGVLTGIGGGMLRIAGAALCFGIRYVAIRRGWQLPVAALPQRSQSEADVANDQDDERGG